MKTLTYVGAHAQVEVPDAGIVADRDVPVDIADDNVAANMLLQADWVESAKTQKPADVASAPAAADAPANDDTSKAGK